jgi:PhnB protein
MPTPDGYHTLTPYLHIRRASEAIEFYKKAFGATEVMRLPMPDGSIAHAEMQIGDSRFMMTDENEEWNNPSPEKLGGVSAGLMLYADDVDASFRQAVDAGATPEKEPTDEFYGDRAGTVIDPFGHRWMIATQIEQLSEEEVQRRMKELAR